MTNTETLRALVEKWREKARKLRLSGNPYRNTADSLSDCADDLKQALSAGDGVAEGFVEVPREATQNMLDAIEGDTPYICRRRVDKTAHEVVRMDNDDWRDVITDDQTVMFTGTHDEAGATFQRLQAEYRYTAMLAAAPAAPVADPVRLAPMCHAVVAEDDRIAVYYHASQQQEAEQFAKERGWECESLFAGSAIDYIVDQRVKAAAPAVEVDEAWSATDADISDWLERHDLEHAISGTDARAAFQDARSAHLIEALGREGGGNG